MKKNSVFIFTAGASLVLATLLLSAARMPETLTVQNFALATGKGSFAGLRLPSSTLGRDIRAAGSGVGQCPIEMHISSVDVDELTRCMTGTSREQKDRHIGDLLGCRHPVLQRDLFYDGCEGSLRIGQGLDPFFV